ncbi:5'-nucleotidase-like isoform X2 [Dreissena polymorpha]|nr:5'-nucleotidase-like isoform X2 [Dreissena polymorpha]
MMKMARQDAIFVVCFVTMVTTSLAFDLTILHTNDVHARFEQFNKYGSDCSEKEVGSGQCYGGVARRLTKLNEIRRSHRNVLLLDAGDQFMGTLWFFLYKGMAAAHFMNKLGYDVMALGNHEFDLGVEELARFLDNVTHDVISSNIDVTRESLLQEKINKSVIKTIGGQRIGIIGYTTQETVFISAPGPTLTFNDEIASIRYEVAVLQAAGVNKIIALGHAGHTLDKEIAKIDGIDVVVGGHTDTFLYTGTPPSNESPVDVYPVVVQQPQGGRALVVQDYTFGKYLGYLNVTFDVNGAVTSYGGNPILLDASVPEDPGLLVEVATWRLDVDALKTNVIGETVVTLDGRREICRLRECNLGNLMADAMVDYYAKGFNHANTTWALSAIAMMNSGGIRASIKKGNITTGNANTVQPFQNEVDLISVTGANLREQLEWSVGEYNPVDAHGRFMQFSGLHVTYNLLKPSMHRVVDVQVRCLECDIPNYSPLKDDAIYPILLPAFIVGGGDGFNFQPIEHLPLNTLDVEVTMSYLAKHAPVYPSVEGRIRFQTPSGPTTSGTDGIVSGMTPMALLLTLCSYFLS